MASRPTITTKAGPLRRTSWVRKVLVLAGREPGPHARTARAALVDAFLAASIDARAEQLSRKKDSSDQGADAIRRSVRDEYDKYVQRHVERQAEWLAERVSADPANIDALVTPHRWRECGDRLDVARMDTAGFRRWLRRLRPDASTQDLHTDVNGHQGIRWPRQDWAARVWLGAVQQAALDMLVRNHRGDVVADEARMLFEDVLRSTTRLGGEFDAPLAWPTAGHWETRLQLAHAREQGRVQLPLRPIATGPLEFGSPSAPYTGRTDEDAMRLARQIRHADGAVLVSGYRGVGKSSFVNRMLCLATAGQQLAPDGWLVVPVTVNVAKSSSVAGVLRLAIRGIKQALLADEGDAARPAPGVVPSVPLPILPVERSLLHMAYIRATWKVALSSSQVDQGEWSAGVDLTIDPGKLVGGAFAPLAKLGAKRARQEKLSRELSLLDYDEDAADQDIGRLIDSLARPRRWQPTQGPARAVRIKLALVFDELDKLDHETGIKPVLAGLKNLFLRQHSVFILVANKRLYYELQQQRVVEDASLSSYFSEVVHVPLLDAAQVRSLLEGWIDRDLLGSDDRLIGPAESRMLQQLSRYLTYKSLGNPRELIRTLRQLQQWGTAGLAPVLNERLTGLPEVAVFAAIQEVLETAAVPWQAGASENAMPGEATMAFERVGGDQARLEQLRRGLYVLVEVAIDGGSLALDEPTLLKLHTDNFSLLSPAEVVRIATLLARHLAGLSVAGTGLSGRQDDRRPLFMFEPATQAHKGSRATTRPARLIVTRALYELTGRSSSHLNDGGTAAAEPAVPGAQDGIVAEVEHGFEHGGRAERMLALSMLGRLADDEVTPRIVDALRSALHEVADPDIRRHAVAKAPLRLLLDPALELAGQLRGDTDEGVHAAVLARLAECTEADQHALATRQVEALLGLDRPEPKQVARTPGFVRQISLDNAVAAFQLLARISPRDLTAMMQAFLVANAAAGVQLHRPCRRSMQLMADRLGVDLLPVALGAWPVRTGVSATLAELLPDWPDGFEQGLAEALPDLVRSRHGARHAEALRYLLAAPQPSAGLMRAVIRMAVAAADPLAAAWVVAMLASDDAGAGKIAVLDRALSGADYADKTRPWLLSSPAVQGDAADRLKTALDRIAAIKPPISIPVSAWGAPKGVGPLDSTYQAALQGGVWGPGVALKGGLSARLGEGVWIPPPTPVRRRFSPDGAGMAMVLAGAMLFLSTMWVPGDIPAGAGLGKLFLARTLSLCFAVSAVWLVVGALSESSEALRRSLKVATLSGSSELRSTFLAGGRSASSSGGWQVGHNMGAVMLIFLAHQEYLESIGPLTFWPTQLVLFVINCTAATLVYLGVRRQF